MLRLYTNSADTGEEFFQGGLNQFKKQLGDQLQDGIYHTERIQVEVEQTGLAPVGLEQNDNKKLQQSRQLVWKTSPILGKDGTPQRAENPLEQYGITVTQGEAQPFPTHCLEERFVTCASDSRECLWQY